MVTREPCSFTGHIRARGSPKVPVYFTAGSLAFERPCPVALGLSPKSEKYLHRTLICLLSMFTFYLVFNFLLFLFKYYIAFHYLANWKLEVTNFDHGPVPPVTPWRDFRNLPRGADEYVNFTFTLSVRNNPPWLNVHVRYVHLYYSFGDIVRIPNAHITFSGDYSITLHPRNYLGNAYIVALRCLDYILSLEDPVPVKLEVEFEPSFFGQGVGLLSTSTLMYFDIPVRDAAFSREMQETCKKLHPKGSSEMGLFLSNNTKVHTKVTWAADAESHALPT